MQKWSHREYQLRLAWIESGWNRPNRTDNYLMYLIALVANLGSKKKTLPPLDTYKLSFKKAKRQTEEQRIAKGMQEKQKWLGMFSRSPVKVIKRGD